MLILDVNKVSINLGYGNLFKNIEFSLNEGEKISIVGPNGCGKSTLFKIIAGLEKCDSGTINIKKGAKVVYLDQVAPDKFDDRIVKNILKDAYYDLLQLQSEMDLLLNKLENESNLDEYNKILYKYGNKQEEFESLGGYDIETNIEKICNGLNISKEKQLDNYNNLSGGEKSIVHMAKVLLQNPDLLLLDEPTNHLDLMRIEWLEKYIKNFKGAVAIISHDRTFLDKVSDKILDLENEEGMVYHTNYSGFLEEKKNIFEKQLANYKNKQRYFDKLEKQAKRFAEAGKATNSTVMSKKAAVMFNRIEREKEKAEFKCPVESKKIKINFDKREKSGKRAIELKNLTIELDGNCLIDNIQIYISSGERIAFVGKNGSGKSAIIKSIVNEQELPISGDIFISHSTKIGYIPQIITFKNEKQTIYEYIQKELGFNEERSRSLLARFLFRTADMNKRVGNLSGGERIRLKLAILLEQKINTIIFDEPTNHIDIQTKESLEEAIDNFDGTVIAVSHDRFFINKFAQKIIEVKDGKVKEYIGNYDNYIENSIK